MKNCPYGRGILGGLVVGIYGWLVGGLVWMKLFGEAAQAHAHLWRPMMGSPEMTKSMIGAYLVIGIFYSLLYAKLSNALNCICCRFQRGIAFGFLCWLPFGFGCGLFWYVLSPISIDLLYAAWLDKALFLIGGGLLLSVIYGDKLAAACDGSMQCSMPEAKSATAAPKKKAATKKKKK